MDMETFAEKATNGWRDVHGFIGPIKPGNGPRSDPKGEFPTGPELGTVLPNVRCRDANGEPFDLEEDRAGAPAVVVFYRSAVW